MDNVNIAETPDEDPRGGTERSRSGACPSELNRYLIRRDAEIVTTHCHHVIVAGSPDGAVRTLCHYHLSDSQYTRREAFAETALQVTHLCHHCTEGLREEVARDEVTD